MANGFQTHNAQKVEKYDMKVCNAVKTSVLFKVCISPFILLKVEWKNQAVGNKSAL